jgi:hypothetical protein
VAIAVAIVSAPFQRIVEAVEAVAGVIA